MGQRSVVVSRPSPREAGRCYWKHRVWAVHVDADGRCYLPCMISNPTVETLDPTITASGGTFNGQGLSFPNSDVLEVWFKYANGTSTLPSSPLTTPRKTITALSGSTPFPGFDVTQPCTVHTYQVGTTETLMDILLAVAILSDGHSLCSFLCPFIRLAVETRQPMAPSSVVQ